MEIKFRDSISLAPHVERRWQCNERPHVALSWEFSGLRKVAVGRQTLKNDDYTTWQYRFTYIDVPLVRLWQPVSHTWWFGLGVQPSILLGKGQEDFFGNGLSDITSFELNPIDFGAIGVVGFHASEHWDIEVRLTQSLLPISPRPEQPVSGWNNYMMNMAIQWMVAWRI